MVEYCVIYRTGTPNAFEWHRTNPMWQADAIDKRRELEAQGIEAMTEKYVASLAIGLPEGWDWNSHTNNPAQWEVAD